MIINQCIQTHCVFVQINAHPHAATWAWVLLCSCFQINFKPLLLKLLCFNNRSLMTDLLAKGLTILILMFLQASITFIMLKTTQANLISSLFYKLCLKLHFKLWHLYISNCVRNFLFLDFFSNPYSLFDHSSVIV